MALDTAVGKVKDLSSLLQLLRDDLKWPLPDEPSIEDITFDWSVDELHVQETQAQRLKGGIVRQLRPLISSQPFGIFLVEFADPQVYRTALRQVVRGLVPTRRRDPALQAWHHENILFICATQDYQHVTFAHFKGDKLSKSKLSTFGWQRESPYVHTLCKYNLPALTWPDDDGHDGEAWLTAWSKAFDKEPLTKEFFKRFNDALNLIKADLEKFQKLKSAEAYSRAQLLLERLVFLYFLQRRGWMDQKRDYLIENFEPHRSRSSEFSYYEDFLEILFWSLASPPNADNRLRGIPFLNGGLFDDDEFALTLIRKKHNPPLQIRNATFRKVFDDFLEAFNFTVREDTPLNQDVAVDPEMLGKVFESIVLHAEAADPEANAPDKRKATGSYYTPRIVVHFICQETLLQYLANHLSGDNWPTRLRKIFDIDAVEGLGDDELKTLRDLLTPSEGRTLLRVVEKLKCCDPAVGSGAFPVGLMHELVDLRRIAGAAANGYVDPIRKDGNKWIHETKEDIVEHCLYGVDIQQQAIEICRLRLWLTLIVDYDLGVDPFMCDRSQFQDAIKKISQLPNLEMNFRRGDSLLDHVSGVPVIVTLDRLTDYDKIFGKIEKLGADLHRAKKSERKKQLRVDILRQRLDLSQRVLEDELKDLERQKAHVTPGLLAHLGFDENASESEKRKRIEHEIHRLQEARGKIEIDRKELEKLAVRTFDSEFFPKLRKLEGADFDSPFNFAWRIDFPNIISGHSTTTLAGELTLVNDVQKQQELPASTGSEWQSGFDIIVGNPPFVTARNREKRGLYAERWPRVCYKNYLLVCPFFEMSFGLLNSKGQLGFIVSNAFAKRDFGKPLIQKFFPTVHIQKVVDCSGLMFPGHGTPTCIVFGKQAKGSSGNSWKNDPIRVAAILPGGGDLRTPPEESPLWRVIAKNHDTPGYTDTRVLVSDFSRGEMSSWPWNFLPDEAQPQSAAIADHLGDYCSEPIGAQFITGKDEAFVLSAHCLRRLDIPTAYVRPYGTGEDVRDWSVAPNEYIIFPYDENLKPLKEPLPPSLAGHLQPHKKILENSIISGSTKKKETSLKWFEFRRLARAKFRTEFNIILPQIATHTHFLVCDHSIAFKEKAQAIVLKNEFESPELFLLLGLLNSSYVLDRLKKECFSKRESEEAETDTYYEFSGGKVQDLAMCQIIAEVMHGKSNSLSAQLTILSKACWVLGQQLTSFALRKLFEKSGEAYYLWNTALPGYVKSASELQPAFISSADLRRRLANAVNGCEKLRGEMIALQEEMDWLVYAAYGLIPENSPTLTVPDSSPDKAPLQREQRPYWVWDQAAGDFDKALALIPSDWSSERKALWTARLTAIRDNEHIRRIEKPVYKRRWDEQWKVGNRWTCGPVAFAAEFMDAFSWWLSEKAEWYLENKAKGGPIELEKWTAALWSDERVQAGWPVAVDCLSQIEAHKAGSTASKPTFDDSSVSFARFVRDVVNDETVPEGISYAVPWDQLEKKRKIPAKVKSIRGKLNVPRERFHLTSDGRYRWAGKA